jgi:hypothetical protein
MNLKKITIVPMLAMALFAVGCGADCESLCEDGKECEGADKDTDCGKVCDEAQEEAEKAGCEDQYDDYISCLGDQDDICKIDEDSCKSETEALFKCAAE